MIWSSDETMRPRRVAFMCPAGFERLAAGAARSELDRFREDAIGGGFVRGSTMASLNTLRGFPCATNMFEVLATTRRTGVQNELKELTRKLRSVKRPAAMPSRGTIRLRLHDDGVFSTTAGDPARRLEAAISTCSGLRVSRANATHEFWVVRRSDLRDVILALKLTPQTSTRLRRGALSKPVASCLARVHALDSRSAVLDPFCGSGAIGRACLEAGAGKVWINDICLSEVDEDLKRSTDARLQLTSVDFREVPIEPGSVTTVVTDPPWGVFTRIEEGADSFYNDFGRVARSWLGSTGTAVLLTGACDEAVRRFLKAGDFELILDEHVLINGRKARILHAV
jgi:predicted RNA methylase